MVFFATRDTVDFHYALVNQFQGLLNSESEAESRPLFLNCKIFRLHGEMEQVDRRTAFQAFNTEKSALLLSTDVAARGLDFPKVRCIVQYDPPGEATEYVHRYVLSINLLFFPFFLIHTPKILSLLINICHFLL